MGQRGVPLAIPQKLLQKGVCTFQNFKRSASSPKIGHFARDCFRGGGVPPIQALLLLLLLRFLLLSFLSLGGPSRGMPPMPGRGIWGMVTRPVPRERFRLFPNTNENIVGCLSFERKNFT